MSSMNRWWLWWCGRGVLRGEAATRLLAVWLRDFAQGLGPPRRQARGECESHASFIITLLAASCKSSPPPHLKKMQLPWTACSNIQMDRNTAVKIRGCFIGIPGKRESHPLPKDDMHLAKVVADLHFVLSTWWSSSARPRIANSDRSFWGMLDVRWRMLAWNSWIDALDKFFSATCCLPLSFNDTMLCINLDNHGAGQWSSQAHPGILEHRPRSWCWHVPHLLQRSRF